MMRKCGSVEMNVVLTNWIKAVFFLLLHELSGQMRG